MLSSMTAPWTNGSTWLRWDPHLHCPDTLLADAFGGDWEGYLQAIETATPAVSAIGVTDYFTLRSYRKMLDHQQRNRLQGILLFPNVELRALLQTDDGSPFNLHFLVSPDDPDHLTKLTDVMRQLTHHAGGEDYGCIEHDLIRLGRVHRRQPKLPDETALSVGALQFKVNPDQVRDLRRRNRWFRENVLIAASAAKDGTGGLRETAFESVREEMGRLADVIFSGNPGNRAYFLAGTPEAQQRGLRPKPCLHGSDAHQLDKVLNPDLDRRCWIRGAATFESLRQTLAEPERRVYIGAQPIVGPSPADTIVGIRIRGADWIATDAMTFNDGLVCIIGAKGSGKTALADLLSLGCGCEPDLGSEASFFSKAREHLHDLEVDVSWGDGVVTTGKFGDFGSLPSRRARYLSQQFVERLCSRTGDGAGGAVSEELTDEIQEVIFRAIPEEDRMGCGSFVELAEFLLQSPHRRFEDLIQQIRDCTDAVATEDRLVRSVESLVSVHEGKKRTRLSHEEALKKIVVRGDNSLVEQHTAVKRALELLRTAIATADRMAQQFRDLEAEVRQVANGSRSKVSALMPRYHGLLSTADWESLYLVANEESLASLLRSARAAAQTVGELRSFGLAGVPLPDGTPAPGLGGLTHLLQRESELQAALGLDSLNAKKHGELEEILIVARAEEERAVAAVTHAAGAPARKSNTIQMRIDAYRGAAAMVAEQEVILQRLYEPLIARSRDDEQLCRIGVRIQRQVDFDGWIERGEKLLDARKAPWHPGHLAELARTALLPAWRGGDPAAIHDAMKAFSANYGRSILDSLRERRTQEDLGRWLFDLRHLRVTYSISYDGVDLRLLSPGTRGIVLLTLYLAIDRHDTAPLIIDQPEENLDPRSIYDVLRPFFREAVQRRQIIMVTHNANLVVNTDSDQVIIATSQRRDSAQLPLVSYRSGGLEDPTIRDEVCQILEGGLTAFQKRKDRYLAAGHEFPFFTSDA